MKDFTINPYHIDCGKKEKPAPSDGFPYRFNVYGSTFEYRQGYGNGEFDYWPKRSDADPEGGRLFLVLRTRRDRRGFLFFDSGIYEAWGKRKTVAEAKGADAKEVLLALQRKAGKKGITITYIGLGE